METAARGRESGGARWPRGAAGRKPVAMTPRLTSCCAGALLLHAALLALGARPAPPRSPSSARRDETEVELLAPDRLEPVPVPVPAPSEPAASEPAARLPTDARPRVAARDPLRRSAARSSSGASIPEAPITPEAPAAEPDAVAGAPPPNKRLSLADLGLVGGGNGAALLQGAQDTPRRATEDVGGLRQARMARDTELGLGPGGAVASAVRTPARELAPLGSQATFSIDLSAEGSVLAISLDGVSSNDTAWDALLRALRERLRRLSVPVGRATRVTVLVTNRSTLRAGNSSSLMDFDLSNIGSPTIQSLHVRVLAQTPL
jgi:hypothetical protein